MNTVTMHQQSRNVPLMCLIDSERIRLQDALESYFKDSGVQDIREAMARVNGARVSDLEGLLHINYVDRDRDLSKVEPIRTERYAVDYGRKEFQPLLDALAAGDFDLAAALTPEKLRLCGYREVKEPYTEEEYAMHGYAANFASTEIPSGVYPVFALEFQRNEVENCFTNHLKDFYGLFIWTQGQCVKSSYVNEDHPFEKTVIRAPYCHALAKEILEKGAESKIKLIYPFEAQPVHFEYDGKPRTSYQIVDTSLPELLKENPMKMRSCAEKQGSGLDDMIAGAARVASQQTQPEQKPNKENHQR